MPLCPIKWLLKVLAKLHKSPTLMANIVKDAVQFLAFEIPLKIMKNTFYFILINWIFYWQIIFCTYYEFSLNQMSDIREVWKHWPLKDGFRSISQKFYRTTILWWVEQKTTNLFDRHFFRERLSKYCIVELTDVFVCLLSSWSRQNSMKWSSNFDGP